jgi:hypothetical protein
MALRTRGGEKKDEEEWEKTWKKEQGENIGKIK